jgi:hypothetical protein
VISDVLKNGAALAIVSSNTSKPLYVSSRFFGVSHSRRIVLFRHDKVLSHLFVVNPEDGNKQSFIQLARYNEASNGNVSRSAPYVYLNVVYRIQDRAFQKDPGIVRN